MRWYRFLTVFTLALLSSPQVRAVRPFITDDARVVGYRLLQWETWVRIDHLTHQSWHMFAYGPHRRVELTLGASFGLEQHEGNTSHRFTGAAPLLQAKFLLNEYKPNRWPGVAIATGSFLPFGKGDMRPPGWGNFSILMLTQSFLKNDQILIHANMGYNYLRINQTNDIKAIWGLGTQIRIHDGFHFVGEVFSGDPYVSGAGTAVQAGFRHFMSDFFQIDMTIGKGFGGSNPMPLWITTGLRMVTDWVEKKAQARANRKSFM